MPAQWRWTSNPPYFFTHLPGQSIYECSKALSLATAC